MTSASNLTVQVLILKHFGSASLNNYALNPDDDIRIVRVDPDGNRSEIGKVMLSDDEPREPWQGAS
jgi:hypothetical protein